MIVAVLLSVLLLLYRASRPYVAVLGRMPGRTATFADLARHPDAELVPGLVIVRLDAPLYFFNANVARTQIFDIVAAQETPPRGVLIDLSATADLDVTTTDMLFELVADLRSRSIEVLVAQVRGTVRDRLRKTGLMDQLGEDRVYLSITSAVNDVGRRWPPAEVDRAVGDALRSVSLEGYEHRSPHHLSTGEKRRVCLAGVLACRPGLLLLDEPSSGLDPRGRRSLAALLGNLAATIIVASHDLAFIRQVCSRVIVLDGGTVAAGGPAGELLGDEALLSRHGLT